LAGKEAKLAALCKQLTDETQKELPSMKREYEAELERWAESPEMEVARPHTYADAVAQTEGVPQGGDPEDKPQYIYTAEDMLEERKESRE